MTEDRTTRHAITRVRQEPRRRSLTVTAIRDVTPRMRRIAFTSPDLADFSSPSPDDHVKVFLPDPAVPGGEVMRDYTPRAFDAAERMLAIDFALHEAGPVSDWARRAAIGDSLVIGGPRGSSVIADDFDSWLLVGDETALPSIGRRIETLRPGVPVTAVMVVEGPEEVQAFSTAADLTPIWLFRRDGRGDDTTLLRSTLAALPPSVGDAYVWIAAEAQTARALRDFVLEERRHPKAWLKAAGYWVRGAAGTSDKMDA